MYEVIVSCQQPVSYTHLRYGYTFLGQKQAFMYKLLPVLIDNMGEASVLTDDTYLKALNTLKSKYACLLYTSRCV